MALSISSVFHCPKPKISAQTSIIPNSSISKLSSSFLRFPGRFAFPKIKIVICAALSAAGSSNPDSDLNPYEVLGVSPIEGFEKVKQVYTRKLKEADKRGDEATAALVGYNPLTIKTSRKECSNILTYEYENMDIEVFAYFWGTIGLLICYVELEKAYDKLMMAQLMNWKKGVT